MKLEIKQLEICKKIENEYEPLVENISFSIEEGEIIGLVGESGSGKTQIALSILQLLPRNVSITKGSILWNGNLISQYREKEMIALRGKEIGIIFQEVMTSLNPRKTIGFLLEEGLKLHTFYGKKERKERIFHMLREVGLPVSEKFLKKYPSELSGGMRQRVMIAATLLPEPQLVIADEPTTALDVIVQQEILQLLQKLSKEKGFSLLFISHNLSLVGKLCHKVMVMKQGRIVEQGTVEEIFHSPKEAYTKQLIQNSRRMLYKIGN